MDTSQIKQLDDEYILPTYARFPLVLASGKGCRAKDADGREYLDFSSGIGVNSLGWCDDEWAAAVANQAANLQHTSNYFYSQPAAQLAQKLCAATGMAKVFFANSGTEANEGAIKAARKYSREKYGAGRHTILTLHNSFHGRTMATLTATGQEQLHKHFDPFLPGFAYLQAGDIATLAAALDGSVCAVMLEPIQGEGGVIPLGAAYLNEVQALCRQQDVLLIADEVQSGVGRTGAFLACQKCGITPDIITLAKGLGGGLPIGAVLLAKGCAAALGAGDHGSTFGANPVCCAAALVVMNRLTDTFLAEVAQKGAALKAAVQGLPHVADVRGDGLMLGILFEDGLAAADVQAAAMQKGLLCLTAKERLRLLPPLVVTQAELNEGVAILRQVLAGLLA